MTTKCPHSGFARVALCSSADEPYGCVNCGYCGQFMGTVEYGAAYKALRLAKETDGRVEFVSRELRVFPDPEKDTDG